MKTIEEHGNGIFSYDLMQNNFPMKSSGFIIHDQNTILIESGMAPSMGQIKKALEYLNIPIHTLKTLVLTHIHIDHAGGAGVLAEAFPDIQIMVHPAAVRHLVDPEYLIENTQKYFKEDIRKAYAPILPIEESRMIAISDGDKVKINEHRALDVLETPGHAFHHLSLFDTSSRSLFMGDVGGVFYRNLKEATGVELCLPNTGPPQFDPGSTIESVRKFLDLDPLQIFYTHYGKGPSPQKALTQTLEWLKMYTDETWPLLKEGRDRKEMEVYYLDRIVQWFEKQGVSLSEKEIKSLRFYNNMNAWGVMHYYENYSGKVD